MKWPIKSSNEWLITISLFLGVIYLFGLFGLNRGSVYMLPDSIHYLFDTHPTSNFLGIETVDAINIFRGEEPAGFEINKITLSVLCNVILYFMIGPFLLYLGYKNDTDGKIKSWYWFVGMVICLGSINIVPKELIDIKIFENTKKYAEENRNRDLMRQELLDLGFAVTQYSILEGGIEQDFQIDDLELKDLTFDYEIEDFAADTMVIIRASNTDDPNYFTTLDINLNNPRLTRLRNY